MRSKVNAAAIATDRRVPNKSIQQKITISFWRSIDIQMYAPDI